MRARTVKRKTAARVIQGGAEDSRQQLCGGRRLNMAPTRPGERINHILAAPLRSRA